jgi:hypothetical protein
MREAGPNAGLDLLTKAHLREEEYVVYAMGKAWSRTVPMPPRSWKP